MKQLPLCISCQPSDLEQGLFGMVLLYPFQILPYLYTRGIYPAWGIRSLHYAEAPDFLNIPGTVDLAYTPPPGPYRYVHLNELRRKHAFVLGNNWHEVNHLWNAYFKIPQRILDRATEVLPSGRILGIHYRGNDKQTVAWDSNPISQDQYLVLLRDFLAARPEYDAVFAASDEPSFIEKLRSHLDLPVISTGQKVEFHLAETQTVLRNIKADNAVLDAVLFSRCSTVVTTSSALPSFAKVFNPDIEIYRCAASKVFTNHPYFPVAFIPTLPVTTLEANHILAETMQSDWQQAPRMKRFRKSFTFLPRWRVNHALFSAASAVKADSLLSKVVTGYQ